jgi:hypothetical protein
MKEGARHGARFFPKDFQVLCQRSLTFGCFFVPFAVGRKFNPEVSVGFIRVPVWNSSVVSIRICVGQFAENYLFTFACQIYCVRTPTCVRTFFVVGLHAAPSANCVNFACLYLHRRARVCCKKKVVRKGATAVWFIWSPWCGFQSWFISLMPIA